MRGQCAITAFFRGRFLRPANLLAAAAAAVAVSACGSRTPFFIHRRGVLVALTVFAHIYASAGGDGERVRED